MAQFDDDEGDFMEGLMKNTFRTVYRPQLAGARGSAGKKDDGDSSEDDIIEIVSRAALQSSSKKRSRDDEDGDDDDDFGTTKEQRQQKREDEKRKARRLLMFGQGQADSKADVKPNVSNSNSAKPLSVADRLAAMRKMAAAAQTSNDATRNKIMLARATVAQRAVAAENAAAAAAAAAKPAESDSAPAASAASSGSQAVDPASTVLVRFRHVAGDDSVFPDTNVRMPVGTALKKLFKRLVKSLRKSGSLPAGREADDFAVRYDGSAVSMSKTLLSIDSEAVQDWLADEGSQDDPACILDVALGAPPAGAVPASPVSSGDGAPPQDAAVAPADDSLQQMEREAEAAIAAISAGSAGGGVAGGQASPAEGGSDEEAEEAELPSAVLVQFRLGEGETLDFPNTVCRVSSEQSISKQFGRLLKKLPGKRLNKRQAAKVFLRFKGAEVQPHDTAHDIARKELLKWVARGSDGAACVFDVHTRD